MARNAPILRASSSMMLMRVSLTEPCLFILRNSVLGVRELSAPFGCGAPLSRPEADAGGESDAKGPEGQLRCALPWSCLRVRRPATRSTPSRTATRSRSTTCWCTRGHCSGSPMPTAATAPPARPVTTPPSTTSTTTCGRSPAGRSRSSRSTFPYFQELAPRDLRRVRADAATVRQRHRLPRRCTTPARATSRRASPRSDRLTCRSAVHCPRAPRLGLRRL